MALQCQYAPLRQSLWQRPVGQIVSLGLIHEAVCLPELQIYPVPDIQCIIDAIALKCLFDVEFARFANGLCPMQPIDPISLITPRRKIHGISAILLPLLADDSVDWESFDGHVARTLDAGLSPAVNMDTGYGHLIDDATREEVLRRTQSLASGRKFVSGAFVKDEPGTKFNADLYRTRIDQIQQFSGIPVIFQSYGLIEGSDDQIVQAYQSLSGACDSFYAFELAKIFAPFGSIYSLDVYSQLMDIKNCIGAKHSSLNRMLEWQRLDLRNRQRPDFRVCTGNDLAIDMVMYGSDYLLGLSTFAPDAFARRDAMWESGDPEFFELNDLLQYLGTYTFRPSVPAYKHSAAMFLHLRNQIATNRTFPGSPERPESDLPVLENILADLEKRLAA